MAGLVPCRLRWFAARNREPAGAPSDTTVLMTREQRIAQAGGVRQWLVELRQMQEDGLISAEEGAQARRAALGL